MRRLMLLLTSLGMIVSTALVPGDTFASGPGQAVTPPGTFFAIWGVITALCIAVGIASWREPLAPVMQFTGWPLIVAQLGFSVWLMFASMNSAVGTVLTFAAILAALLIGISRLTNVSERPGRRLVAVTLGLYAGWSSAAIWLNVVTTAPARFADSQLAQAVCIAGAGATVLLVLRFLRPPLAYPAAAAWALTGVCIAAAAAQAWLPLTVALVSAGAVAGTVARSTRAATTRRRVRS